MHEHKTDKDNEKNLERHNLLKNSRKYKGVDGLNSLAYKVCR